MSGLGPIFEISVANIESVIQMIQWMCIMSTNSNIMYIRKYIHVITGQVLLGASITKPSYMYMYFDFT